MNLSTKKYFEPTSKNIRIFGDSLLAFSTTASGFAVIENYPKLGVAIMILGSLGKFISNFISQENENNN